MSYKPSDPYYKEFTTANPSTGAAQNADSLPTATANHNGTDDGTFVLTVTNIDTGRYKITGTIPSGYAAGDVLNVSVAATVNGVAGKAIVDTQVLDSARLNDINNVAGQSLANAVRHIGATVAGQISGAGTGTEVFKDFSGAVAVTVTVDASGNRTNVAYV